MSVNYGPLMDAARLDQLVAKVLREELREDENSRKQGLEQFRDWILKNPDIRDCITDDSFLLPFLRVRKYSIPMAEETLMRFLKFQHKFPSINSQLDIEDPYINDATTSGFCFLSPFRQSNGQGVMIGVARNLDITKHTYQTAVRAIMLFCHGIARTEDVQIVGHNSVLDYGQVVPAFFTACPVAVLKAIVESFEKCFPLRIKTVHIINLPPVATWFFQIVLSTLSDKIRSRIMFHSSLDELHKHIDPSVLPKEYGGTMTTSEMTELWKKQLAKHRESILAINNIKLVGDSFKNDLEHNDMGVPGSFRQLAVD